MTVAPATVAPSAAAVVAFRVLLKVLDRRLAWTPVGDETPKKTCGDAAAAEGEAVVFVVFEEPLSGGGGRPAGDEKELRAVSEVAAAAAAVVPEPDGAPMIPPRGLCELLAEAEIEAEVTA